MARSSKEVVFSHHLVPDAQLAEEFLVAKPGEMVPVATKAEKRVLGGPKEWLGKVKPKETVICRTPRIKR